MHKVVMASNADKVIYTKQMVGEYAHFWLNNIKRQSCEQITIHGYSNIVYNYMIPHLGNIELQKLSF